MNGPDHYKAAEELLAAAADHDRQVDRWHGRNDMYAARVESRLANRARRDAQVHATLALAAATARGAVAGWDEVIA